MKNVILFILLLVLAGCTNEGQGFRTYLEEPQWFIKDPHYANYRDKRDELESQYLQKNISYAEYVEKRDKIEETYNSEVQDRNKKVSPSQF